MTEKFRSLEEIVGQFPPKAEVFDGGKRGKWSAVVYRNEEGEIVYVKPKSMEWVERGEQQKAEI